MRGLSGGLLLSAALALAAPLEAGVIASSTFDTDSEGWLQGAFDQQPSGDPIVVGYVAPGYINIDADRYPYAGFLAPSKFLGDLTAARGGTLSFDLTDAHLDDAAPDNRWTAYVALVGANGMLIYGGLKNQFPDTTQFTHFSFSLTADSFYTEGNLASGHGATLGGRLVTEAEFDAVLADVARFAIPADFVTGIEDNSSLDNVVLTAGVPEPVTWALALAGFRPGRWSASSARGDRRGLTRQGLAARRDFALGSPSGPPVRPRRRSPHEDFAPAFLAAGSPPRRSRMGAGERADRSGAVVGDREDARLGRL